MISKINKFLAGIRPEEWLAIAVFVVAMSINIFVYQQEVPLKDAWQWMVYYFTFGEPFYGLFFTVVYLLALWDFYRLLSIMAVNWILKNKPPTKPETIDLVKKLLKPIRVVLPIVITTLPMYQLLSHFSYELRDSGKDLILAAADQNLIGGLLFVYLPTAFSAVWIGKLVYYAYLSLALMMSGLLVWLFLLKKETLFRLAVTAFIFSYVFSYPLFYLMPCQAPSVYFVLNEKNFPTTPKIQAEMDTYKPSSFTTEKINKIVNSSVSPDKDDAVPISCFPSMHAVWSLIVIYFLARISRYTILFSVPWLVLNLSGGLYFAQHYLVDYIVAIPIAMLSISCAYWLLKIKKRV